MQGFSIIARRYSGAFLDLAREKGILEQVYRDMEVFLRVTNESAEFRAFLKNPAINPKQKSAAFTKAFDGKLSEAVMLFARKLIDVRREMYIGEIAAAFIQKYKELNGILTVNLTSAQPIDDSLRQQIAEIVKKDVPGAEKSTIEFEEKIDASIIGGIILQVKDKKADGSIARKIRDFKRSFADNPYVAKI